MVFVKIFDARGYIKEHFHLATQWQCSTAVTCGIVSSFGVGGEGTAATGGRERPRPRKELKDQRAQVEVDPCHQGRGALPGPQALERQRSSRSTRFCTATTCATSG